MSYKLKQPINIMKVIYKIDNNVIDKSNPIISLKFGNMKAYAKSFDTLLEATPHNNGFNSQFPNSKFKSIVCFSFLTYINDIKLALNKNPNINASIPNLGTKNKINNIFIIEDSMLFLNKNIW